MIKPQNLSINNVTISDLYQILDIYIGYVESLIPLNLKPPAEVTASLEEALQVLKTQGDNAAGVVEISRYLIAFEYINFILKARGIHAQNVSLDQLWLIIELSVEIQKKSGKAEINQAILNFFIEILSNAERVNNSVLVADKHSVSLREIVIALGLKINNSNIKYDTANLTTSILLRATMEVSELELVHLKQYMERMNCSRYSFMTSPIPAMSPTPSLCTMDGTLVCKL
jgi:hypothetical protein